MKLGARIYRRGAAESEERKWHFGERGKRGEILLKGVTDNWRGKIVKTQEG